MGEALYQPVNVASRTDQAVAILTDLITSGQIASGDFLPSEAELCRRLGVSRPTVREALRTLETRGLVLTRHGVGIQVTDRTRQVAMDSISLLLRRQGAGLRDMLEVRLMLECQGAALAAQRATAEDIRAIAEAHSAMSDSLGLAENVRADLEFHVRIAEASKNEVLVTLVHAIRGLLRDTIATTFQLNPKVADRLVAHGRILAGIRAHAPAEAAMRSHLQETEALVFQHFPLDADSPQAKGGGAAEPPAGAAAR